MRNETKEYIEQPIFDGKNFYQYDKSDLSEKAIHSQNDLLVVYPDELVERLGLQNPIQHISWKDRYDIENCPNVFVFVSSESRYKKKYVTPDEHYTDYYEVDKDWIDIVYHIFTDIGIYRVSKTDGGEWFIEELYIHNLGCVTVEIIKGKEISENAYAPIIYPAMWGYGDNVLNQKSDATIVTANNAHAIKIVKKTMCPKCKGTKQVIKGFQTKTCEVCDSNGLVYIPDPNGVIFEKTEYSHTEQMPHYYLISSITRIETAKLLL